MLDVLVAGELYADLILSGFDFWPKPGQEAFAREFRREIGGGAAITACGLARLGTRTGVFGIAGSDHHGWLAQRFAEAGVDTAHLSVDADEPTAFTVAVSTPADRAFFTYLGANRGFARAFREAADAHRLHAGHVHLGFAPAWDTAAELIGSVHANGCTLSIDAGWYEDWLTDRRALEVLPKVDLFFPNESEAALMTGEVDPERMLHRFHVAGFRIVALKLGANGAGLLWNGEMHFGVPPAVTVRDTTGAGDCFDAGFLHAWLSGESAARCLRAGNVSGALSCEAYGGIAGFPSRERLATELERA